MFGNDRTLFEDTKLGENFCCGVGKNILGVPDAPSRVFGNDRTFVEDTKLE